MKRPPSWSGNLEFRADINRNQRIPGLIDGDAMVGEKQVVEADGRHVALGASYSGDGLLVARGRVATLAGGVVGGGILLQGRVR